jgi:UDP-glucuronate 4-epimerase
MTAMSAGRNAKRSPHNRPLGADSSTAPQRVLVTGAAGFIAHHTIRKLLTIPDLIVVGVDCLLDNYSLERKRNNIALLNHPRFEFHEGDLAAGEIEKLFRQDFDAVLHLAALPGVRPSWSSQFSRYVANNINVTQYLLEAARHHKTLKKFVFASSSSVYGNAKEYPTTEDVSTQPHSPYGVTKLAAENLCSLYAQNHGLATVSLRYFTVYGPRQRPDMAIQRIIQAAISRDPFTLYGSGEQERDFTFVDDVAHANVLALCNDVPPGTVANVAGGTRVSLAEVIATVERVVGSTVPAIRTSDQPGDVFRTVGDTAKIFDLLGWTPKVDLEAGIEAQAAHAVAQTRAHRDGR